MNIDLEKFKLTPKISSGVVLLSFLFPFFVIKCGNVELAKPTGIQLVTGKDSITQSAKDSESKDLEPQPAAMAAFLMAILITVFAWVRVKNHNMVTFILACVGLVTLIILLINMKSLVVDSADGEDDGLAKMITVSGTFGYWLCILGFMVYGAYHGLSLKQGKDNYLDQGFIDDGDGPPDDGEFV